METIIPTSTAVTELDSSTHITIRVIRPCAALNEHMTRWKEYVGGRGEQSLNRCPAWLAVLAHGLKHEPYCIEASVGERLVGLLPLAYVKSLLFGKFLVSLPYLNSGGVLADSDQVSGLLIDRAVELADELRVQHLELRHEVLRPHPALTHCLTSKVHMRLALPGSSDDLWKQLHFKVRNKVRKGEKQGFTIHWGSTELLTDFYDVFSHNMCDLGTPVFSRRLFSAILHEFPGQAELCVVRADGTAVATALLMHGEGVTETPSASSLRAFGTTNVNDWMYWQLLQRAVNRGQCIFDFGRSTIDSNTYVFKKKWGALAHPAVWQYYVRRGTPGDMRRENGKYDRFISCWQKLPLGLTRLLGPPIVRGIP
ncbi:MAG: FemAB family XrtA/PEP-CTERM system-associated protein [Pirellulaceae bacterium]